MKRTIIIAASAVTLAAAGIAGSQYLSGQSRVRSSRWKRHRKSGKKNPKTAAGRRRRQPSCKGGNCPPHFFHSDTGSRHDNRLCHPSLQVRSVFPKEDCRQPRDNIFEINLSRTIPSDARVWLCYEAAGCGSLRAVAKSINDRPATGGYMAASSDGWTRVREEIHPAWLHAGVNRILFTAPEGRAIRYATCMSKRHRDPGRHLRCHKLR